MSQAKLLFPYERIKNQQGVRPRFWRASGYRLWTSGGDEYIEGNSGTWHVNFGYNEPSLIAALSNTTDQLNIGSLVNTCHEEAFDLADRLTEYLKLPNYGVFFTNSGSEAVEAARWVAEKTLQCKKNPNQTIVSLPGSFHGLTSGNRALAANPLDIRKSLEGSSSGLPGAVIYEPVQTGVRLLAPAFVEYLRELQRQGVLIISDEVGCGLGRTGHAVASSIHNITPDILIVSKGLTGGLLPLAAVLISPSILETIQDEVLEYSHTHAASPVTCRVAIAALKLFEKAEIKESMVKVEATLEQLVSEIAEKIGGSARHIGLLGAVELPNIQPLNFDERQKAYATFLNQKAVLRISPADGKSLPILPGYTYSQEDFSLLRDRALKGVYNLLDIINSSFAMTSS